MCVLYAPDTLKRRAGPKQAGPEYAEGHTPVMDEGHYLCITYVYFNCICFALHAAISFAFPNVATAVICSSCLPFLSEQFSCLLSLLLRFL